MDTLDTIVLAVGIVDTLLVLIMLGYVLGLDAAFSKGGSHHCR